jgi:hypothetical protein
MTLEQAYETATDLLKEKVMNIPAHRGSQKYLRRVIINYGCVFLAVILQLKIMMEK